ncbi:plasmid partition protein ParG [Morganella sp. EGD-HP17]|uniref:plasmid partition protein ParG n=1 Tax=Morganella sp. EGD-HP17 TaxID=1435146 RepID=UPI0003FA515B|nr:plasmid partition protein ParG [Morganella sp. EGD-HP17]ETO41299.1 hypothetical protein X965_10895 [Morganella sp. EGD-HP17]
MKNNSKLLMKSGQNRQLSSAIDAIKKPSLPTKKLQMNIPEELHQRFKFSCLKQNVDMTDIVISLVIQWLTENEDKP